MEMALKAAAFGRSSVGLALGAVAALGLAGLVGVGRFDDRLGDLSIFAGLGIAGAPVTYCFTVLWPASRLLRGFGL